ncbi:MAG: TIGR00725 family protein [Chloroflexi bacterium]|nr:TIGR00725 family protein [Chloroflexota bacterium]
MKNGKFIGVIGGSQCTAEEARLAEEVGREVAKRGAILVCGGLGGVMEAACKGASSEGGVTVGILPGDNRQSANPYVSIPVVTGLGHARNIIVVRSSQAIIAVGGAYGTLSELGHALQNNIPVIGLNTWSLSRNGKQDTSIIPAQNAVDAVEIALSLANQAPARVPTPKGEHVGH